MRAPLESGPPQGPANPVSQPDSQSGSAPSSEGQTAELICSYDLNGNIIESNEALERAIGYTRQELRGMNLSRLIDPSFGDTAHLNIPQHAGTAGREPQRIVARARDGRPVTIDLTTRLVFEKGVPVAVQGFGHNISKAGHDPLSQAGARFSARDHELAQFTGHLKQLHRLSTTNYDSLDKVFSDFLKTGCELFRLETGMVLQADGDDMLILAVQGSSTTLHLHGRIPLPQTCWTSVADRLRTQVSSGAGKAGIYPELRICVAAPILVDAELYGTLSFSAEPLHRGTPGAREFSSAEREIIELMARSIGRSILEDRIRSERRSGEDLERNRNRVLEMMAENRPLTSTLAQLAAMLENRCPGALCSVLVARDGLLLCEAAPNLPVGYARAINEIQIAVPGEITSAEGSSLLSNFRDCDRGTPLDTAHFPFAERLGLEFGCTSPILSGAGLLLGAIVVHYHAGSRNTVDREVMRMACRLAGIAIEQRQLTDRLEFQAQHDSLTGLPNRFHLLELLAKRLLDAASRDGLLAVFFIDLDRFKQINDTLGHLVGDRILIQVTERLKRGLLHEDDVAGRMGGDEFIVILSHPPDQDVVFRAARQFLQYLRAPYLVDDHELFVTASMGISFYPHDGTDAATLLQKSDSAMYSAKNAGKNDLEFFVKDSRNTAMERLEMENALRRALEKSELELNFQPIVSINGELDGLEVLLAWNHPRLGRISPKQFIPIAEESGLIVSIGSWVLHQACLQGARWNSAGLHPARLGVNVSAIQFARHDFVDTVAAALAATNFPARWLDLELTESFVIRDIAESALQLARLRELGVRISIDDFGTGYSSLSYLRQLPVDTLKIDQSFLRDLHAPAGSLPVVQTIVSLAHNMNLSVVAEGVETLEDLELLRLAGCDKVQGHLYGESLRGFEAEQLLANKDRIVPALTR